MLSLKTQTAAICEGARAPTTYLPGVSLGAETDCFSSSQSTQLLEQEVKENKCQKGRDMKTTTVTQDFCFQEWRPGCQSPPNEFHWMHPRDQLEGGRNIDVKRQEKVERGEAKEWREREGEKEQMESRYIKKQEQQTRGVSDAGCETPMASIQMQRNPMEDANREDANWREK
ncbi:hypothetical protein NDU88_002058 [Pleurodeles waltl]|uniref:Uncharacterized protein n=1 Tax=Pleurodeles waltl TaxID=8319 RepID=A0AAV7NCJ9_PLEWA|nr:hypothetical protein NDU88_002058 [Pleurodeles waltl]